MLSAEQLKKKPRQFRNFTGLTPEQFDLLLAELMVAYEQSEAERVMGIQR